MCEYDYYDEKYCKKCERKDEVLENSRDWLQKVVHILYGKEEFNKRSLENALDELCYALDVNIVVGDLTVTEEREKVINF